MHCNLRPPDIAPVVLGFNYKVHDAPAANSKTPQHLSTHICTQVPNFISDNTRLSYFRGRGDGELINYYY